MSGDTLSFSDTVSGEIHGDVLVTTIDNPPVNALSADTRTGLMAALDHAAGNGGILGLVIAGAGKTFIGGADIKEFGQLPVEPILPTVIQRIEDSGKPVVAAINGAALGGGVEVALGCHARMASPAAQLGLPEVKLGLVPGAGGTQRLPRLIGIPAAIDLIGSGRSVKSQEAQSLGLVDEIVEADLKDAAVATIRRIAVPGLRRTGNLPLTPAEPAVIEAAMRRISLLRVGAPSV